MPDAVALSADLLRNITGEHAQPWRKPWTCVGRPLLEGVGVGDESGIMDLYNKEWWLGL